MPHQQPVSVAQKKQPKLSSDQQQTSLTTDTAHPLLKLQRTAGNQAVQQVLSAHPPVKGQGQPTLQRQANPGNDAISTPLGNDAVLKRNGSAVLQVGETTVTIKPDTFSHKPGQGAETTFKFENWHFSWRTKNGKIATFTSPKIALTIQTEYKQSAKPSDRSGYGKGTAAEDIAQGKTTLRYHEGSHGLDFIQFLQDNPLPVFTGESGMSVADFQKAIASFDKAMDEYRNAMQDFSIARTDCIGTTIDEFNHVYGITCKG